MNLPYWRVYGGANRSNRSLAESLAAAGHAVHVVAPAEELNGDATGAEELRVSRGVHVHLARSQSTLRVALAEAIDRERPQWVLVSSEDPSQSLLRIALDSAPGRVLYLAHTPQMFPFGPAALYPGVQRTAWIAEAAGVIVISRFMADYVQRWSGLDAFVFHPPHYAPPARQPLGRRDGCVLLLNVCAAKGAAIFEGLAGELAEVAFAAVPGYGTTADDLQRLQRFANVRVLPNTKDVQDRFAEASVLLMPSLWLEGFGMSVVDAMLCGVPVLAADHGGLREASLGVCPLVPVSPIERFGPEHDDRNLPKAVVPAQDIAPWASALRDLISDRDWYTEQAERSLIAATAFAAGLSVGPFESLLKTMSSRRAAAAGVVPRPVGRAVVESLTREQLAALMTRLKKRAPADVIPSAGELPEYPLSSAQERLWFLQQLEPHSAAYNVTLSVRVDGSLDVQRLHDSFRRLVMRHAVLRTVFRQRDGIPVQVVLPHPATTIMISDVRESGDAEARARELVAELRDAPFDFTQGPAVRALLLRVADDRHVIALVCHHALADGWSFSILARDWIRLYDSEHLEDLPLRFVDFVVWQRGLSFQADLEYWKTRLGDSEPLELPFSRPREKIPRHRGAALPFHISREVTDELNELGRRHGATLFMVIVALVQTLLHRYTEQDAVSVGAPATDRPRPELEGVAGCFIETLVLRTSFTGNPTFVEVLLRVRQCVLEALAHRAIPFEKLVDELRPERDLARNPLFEVLVVLQNTPPAPRTASSLDATPFPVPVRSALFDLTFGLTENPDGLLGAIEYDADLFDGQTIDRMSRHLETIINIVRQHEEARVGDAPLEQADIVPAPRSQPFVSLYESFARQAEATPEAIAVRHALGDLTYGDLALRAAKISTWLRKSGAHVETLIGVEMPRVPNLIAAILAVLRCGSAYLPLDLRWPKPRRDFITAQAAPLLTVTEREVTEALQGIAIESDCVAPSPEAAAYLLYTSGSTGEPKGVVIEQRAAAAFVAWAVRHFGRDALSTVLASTSVCFDLSVFEIFAPLAVGGSLALVDDIFSVTSAELERVTLINTVPSAADALSQSSVFPVGVPVVSLAGEVVSQDLVDTLYRHHAAGRVYDLYGPTEATTYSTSALREERGSATIGVPIAGTEIWILDRYGQPAPVEIAGEIYIGGAGLARGYLKRAGLTADRFVPHPFRVGERLYRTGDRGSRSVSGTLRYLGRSDRQVKVRGFRVEPGEVEEVLRRVPGVREAAVVARAGRLVAWICGDATATQARAFIAARLPDYMVPSTLQVIDAVPRLPNGKVDWKTLEARVPEEAAATDTRAWPSSTVELLASIWEAVLGVPVYSPEDSFFELGGHSLQAVQVVARIQSWLGVDLPLRALFLSPRLIDLARVVDGSAATMPMPAIPPPPDGEYPLSFAQSRMWYLDAFRPANSAYNIPSSIRLRGALRLDALKRALDALIERQASLRTVFPDAQRQRVLARFSLTIGLVDLSALPPGPRAAELERLLADETAYGFSLGDTPPIRVRLIRLGADDHVLVMTLHHIIADAWSMQILLREWALLYEGELEGKRVELPPLSRTYGDYAAWQRQALDRGQLDEAVAYWQRQLRDIPPLEIRTDRERTSHLDNVAGTIPVQVAPATVQALKNICREEGATLFMGIAAAWIGGLWRYSGQDEIAVGAPVAGRIRSEAESMIGCFVNTVIVRVRCGDDPPFRELVRRVRQAALDAYTYQEVPFERLIEETTAHFQHGRAALFQSMLTLQNVPVHERRSIGGLSLEPIEVPAQKAKAELALSLHERDAGLSGVLEYDAGLFDPPTVAELLSDVERLLGAWTADPDQGLGSCAIGPRPLQPRTLDVAPPLSWIHPPSEAIAIRSDAATWTYRELHVFANGLAAALAARAIGPDCVVAVCAGRSPQLVGTFLGVLKAGAAFLGLDPDLPPSRLASLVSDSRAHLVILDSPQEWAGAFPSLLTSEIVPEEAEVDRGSLLDPDHLAYVVFTSGTTGRPKCVGLTHRGVSALDASIRRTIDVDASDTVLQFSSISFDAFVWEMVMALGAGASLRVGDRDAHATVATLPPSYAGVIDPADGIRTLIVAGEACGPHALDRWWPNRSIFNAYGPSEATVCAAVHPCQPGEGVPPIGRALDHSALYVLDRHLNVVPAGVDGELYIGGAGVARGYLNDAPQTAARFVPDPFGGRPGARLYRSGDIVRWRRDGSLEFIGRRDHQIKLHGYRIELGEIEAAIAQSPGVTGAVVLLQDGRLIAYVRGRDWTSAALSAEVRQRLPAYMMPAVWVAVDEFPTTITGKIDRPRLTQQRLPGPRRRYDPPRSRAEQILAAIWKEELHLEDVGVHENYFELGGDSVLGIRILARARQVGLRLNPRQLFENPTIAGLAAAAQFGVIAARRMDSAALSPIQQWFFRHAFADPHHFNQAVMLRPLVPIRTALLERAVRYVCTAHAALRLRFEQLDGIWRQTVQHDRWPDVPEIDLSEAAEPARALAHVVDDLQQSLDPFAGINLRVASLRLGPAEQRIWVGMHHLICDTMSWGTLLEDLQRICEALDDDRSPDPLETDYSFLAWADASPDLDQTAPSDPPGARVPLDEHGINVVSSEESVVSVIPVNGEQGLEQCVLNVVARVLTRWADAGSILIDVERHGRDADTLRAIGWFTSIVPMRIGEIGCEELAPFQRGSEVCFNYFGRLSSYASTPAAYALAPESPGRTRSPRQHRTHVIDLTASVDSEGLRLVWTFSRNLHRRSTIERLASETARLLERREASIDGRLAGLDETTVSVLVERYPDAEDILPLTPLQEGLLFHQLEGSETAPYHQQVVSTIHSDLDPALLREAWSLALLQHPALRAAFVYEETDHPVQVICRRTSAAWRFDDWRTLDAEAQSAELQQFLLDDRRQPFDLRYPPLMRFAMFQVGDREFRFVWTHHHILLDGWSLPILIAQVIANVDALQRQSPPPPAGSYRWRNYLEWIHSQSKVDALAYWRRTLEGFLGPKELPLFRSRPNANDAALSCQRSITLTEHETAALEASCRAARATLGAAVAASWAMLLSRYAGSDDVVAGLTFALRPPEVEGAEAAVGLLLNTLPLRIRTDVGVSVRQWLRMVRDDVAALQRHGFVSLSDIRRCAGVTASTAMFHSIVVVENYPVPASAQPLPVSIDGVEVHERTHYPMSLGVSPGSRLRLRLTYDAAHFDGDDVQQLLGELRSLLANIADRLDAPMVSVAWPDVREAEQRGLRVDRVPMLLHESFEQTAAQWPDAVAVWSDGSGSTTYRELDLWSGEIAGLLRARSVGVEDVVALRLERGARLAATVLGVLKTGAAYLLLDPIEDDERQQWMIRDSGAVAIIDANGIATTDRLPRADRVFRRPSVENLAYVVYTSGTTGRPKGCLVTHAAISNRLAWSQSCYPLTAADRVLLSSRLGFDFAVWELHAPWMTGAAVVFPSSDDAVDLHRLGDLVDRGGVTVAHFVPSAFAAFLEQPVRPSLRLVFSGGEPLPAELARKFDAAYEAKLVNQYGPAEATIDVTHLECRVVMDDDLVSIGRPIDNAAIVLLSSTGRPVVRGGTGEICIGGVPLARGYLGRPALTAERFVPHPDPQRPGERLYRTGDLGRWRADGTLEIRGRVDRQVKVRGVRIEPTEIESCLLECHGVVQSRVVARRKPAGDVALAAFVVLADDQTIAGVREHVQRRLPAVMRPATWSSIDRFPTRATGKVDDDQLLALAEGRRPIAGRAPRSTWEELCCSVWEGVLEIPSISIDDDFYALGGDSIAATRITSRLNRATGAAMSVRDVLEHPTVAALAEVASGKPSPQHLPEIELARTPLTLTQAHVWLLDQTSGGTPRFLVPSSMMLEGPLDIRALARAFDLLVEHYEILRTVFRFDEDGLWQEALPYSGAVLQVVDVSTLDEDQRWAEASRLAREEQERPFRLDREPAFRGTLVRVDAAHHLLLVTTHHIVCDGWSNRLIAARIADAYRGTPPAPPSRQFGSVARAERIALYGGAYEPQLQYWMRRLESMPAVPFVTKPAAIEASVVWDESIGAAVKRLAARHAATPFITLLAAFHAVLRELLGETDIGIATLLANRAHADWDDQIGLFLNTVVLRIDAGPNPTFRDVILQARRTLFEAYSNGDVPFPLVAHKMLEAGHTLARTCRALFVFNNVPGEAADLITDRSEVWQRPVASLPAPTTFSWIVNVNMSGAAIELTLIGPDASNGGPPELLRRMRILVERMVADPDRPVSG